jgi:hypothetical protein
LSKELAISKSPLGRFVRREIVRIRVDFVLKIAKYLNLSLEEIERNIIWIGNNNSNGITNPKLPFDFSSRYAARFLAAICNDGCITNTHGKGSKFSYGSLQYYNNDLSLLSSIAEAAHSIFGGNPFKVYHRRNETFLMFPSILRDVLMEITDFQGIKSENNPRIPCIIFEDLILQAGWIEQTIADEGCIMFYPHKYRREVVWRRSFNKNLQIPNLIEDEKKILTNLGISFDVRLISKYSTKKGIQKVRYHVRLACKQNIKNLAKLINIPSKRKNELFLKMVDSIK